MKTAVKVATWCTFLVVGTAVIIALTSCSKPSSIQAEPLKVYSVIINGEGRGSLLNVDESLVYKKVCVEGVYYWASQTQGLRWVLGGVVLDSSSPHQHPCK